MKITFFGTGTSHGVPVIGCNCDVCLSDDWKDKRLRASVLVQSQGLNILIDSGPDFRYQMLRAGVNRLDAILITHEHRDHISGLDDVRALNMITGSAVEVYAEPRVSDSIHSLYHYAFSNLPFNGLPRMEVREIGEKPFFVGGVAVNPVRVMHYKLPIFAYRIGDFGYVTDANYISPESIDKLRGCKVLVVNGLMMEKHISHFSLSEALEVIADVNPRLGVITHISHLLGKHADVSRILPPNVILGYDTLSLTV
jgi:phosphoribosyl 1,2-cyclic phosphate phosphodiesterase